MTSDLEALDTGAHTTPVKRTLEMQSCGPQNQTSSSAWLHHDKNLGQSGSLLESSANIFDLLLAVCSLGKLSIGFKPSSLHAKYRKSGLATVIKKMQQC